MHLPAARDQLCRPPSLHPCPCLPFSLARWPDAPLTRPLHPLQPCPAADAWHACRIRLRRAAAGRPLLVRQLGELRLDASRLLLGVDVKAADGCQQPIA